MTTTALIFVNIISTLFFGTPDAKIKKAKDDFLKANKAFSAQNISVQMVYNFYESYDTYTPVETQTGLFYKKGNKDYSNIMNTETLHTPEMTVVAEHNEKILVVSGPASNHLPLSVGVDTLLMMCKEVITKESTGERLYELVFGTDPENEFNKIEVNIDIATYRINKLVLFYNDREKIGEDGKIETIHPKVEIVYWNYNKVKVNESEVFSSSTYVSPMSGNANKFKCASKFSSYKMYNQKIK